MNAHVGYLDFKKVQNADYTDWKLGVTKDINGWVVGLSYIDTNAKGDCNKGQFYCFSNSLDAAGNFGSKTMNAGRATGVLSISKSF